MNSMHNDPASLLGRASATLTVGGRKLRVYPLTYDDLAELKVWVNEQLPDPVDAVVSSRGYAKLPPEGQKYAIRIAVELAAKGARQLSSPEAGELLNSPEGVIRMFYLMVRRGDPSFTEADAAEIGKHLTPGDVGRLQAAAYNIEPSEAMGDGTKGEGEGETDPKGRGGPRKRTGGGCSTRS